MVAGKARRIKRTVAAWFRPTKRQTRRLITKISENADRLKSPNPAHDQSLRLEPFFDNFVRTASLRPSFMQTTHPLKKEKKRLLANNALLKLIKKFGLDSIGVHDVKKRNYVLAQMKRIADNVESPDPLSKDLVYNSFKNILIAIGTSRTILLTKRIGQIRRKIEKVAAKMPLE